MNKTISIGIMSILMFQVAFAYNFEPEDTKQLISGDLIIQPDKIEFLCENTVTSPLDDSTIVKAPHGDKITTCECTGYNDYENYCYRTKCVSQKDVAVDYACWEETNYDLEYNTEKEIQPYVKTIMTTNAQHNSETKLDPSYYITLDVDINAEEGLLINIDTAKVTEQGEPKTIKVTYINKINKDLEGELQIKQLNWLSLGTSTIETIPITFESGTHVEEFNLDKDVLGNAEIFVQGAIILKEVKENELSSTTFLTKEAQINTKTQVIRDTENTALYTTAIYNPEQTRGFELSKIFTYIGAFINGLI